MSEMDGAHDRVTRASVSSQNPDLEPADPEPAALALAK